MPVYMDVEDAIATLTIEGRNHLNPFTPDMVRDLAGHFEELDRRPDIRVAILTGAGAHFSVGGNMKSGDEANTKIAWPQSVENFWYQAKEARRDGNLVHQVPLTPMIAATRGWAAGMGLVMLLQTSIRIAGESSRYAFGEIRWARPTAIDYSGMPSQISFATACQFATGEAVDAFEAKRIRLVNEVVPDDQVLSRARQVAERIAALTPSAVRAERLALRPKPISPRYAAIVAGELSALHSLKD
jgi:enoyl-CoA hydratase/carnithine racemase